MGRAQGEVPEGASRTCMIVQNDKNRDAECKGAAPITLRDRVHG